MSCPIALYPAVSAAERVSFRQVSKRTGHRLRHHLVNSVTGETVELLRKKQQGVKIERPKAPAKSNVVNLMDALRASLAETGKAPNVIRPFNCGLLSSFPFLTRGSLRRALASSELVWGCGDGVSAADAIASRRRRTKSRRLSQRHAVDVFAGVMVLSEVASAS